MAKIAYEQKKFREATLAVIKDADKIITTYQDQGFSLTLRQLYYQFVAKALIPNTESSYNKLGNIISDARRAGMIDWEAIEDRTRYVRSLNAWDNPQSILESAKDSYHRDLWANQNTRLEVWIEKDALVGVIEDICRKNDVPFASCRGFESDSELWRAAMRMSEHNRHGQRVIVLHLGDHDPSGIDMTRDIQKRLSLFSFGASIHVHRIALTMEQIQELQPPPNPAKTTDSRYKDYVKKYGVESWELDALNPQYIVDLVDKEIKLCRDDAKWEQANQEQEFERGNIASLIDRLALNIKQKCTRCGYEWFPRILKLPIRCPNCRSPYWYSLKVKQSGPRGK